MFSSYFDSSYNGCPKGGSRVVAGWLATGEQWYEFNQLWQGVLAKADLPYMHMREFAHSTGAFSHGWKGLESKRIDLIEAFNSVIERVDLNSFLCALIRSDYENVSNTCSLNDHFGSDYALCSYICVQQVQKWLDEKEPRTFAEYIFEDGDSRGNLVALMRNAGYLEPVFRPAYVPDISLLHQYNGTSFTSS